MTKPLHCAAGLALAAALTLPAAPPVRAFTDTGSTWAAEVIQKAADYQLMGFPTPKLPSG